MTERGARTAHRARDTFQIGPSRMAWDGTALTVEIDETAVPHLAPIRGRVRLTPEALTGCEAPLTPDGTHVWQPFAPLARVEVALYRPGLRWTGHGYLDANFGTRALEADFVHWNWSRSRIADAAAPGGARARIFYEADRRDGTRLALDLETDRAGALRPAAGPTPPAVLLPGTLWRVARGTRSEGPARVRRRLEDAPFYARAMLETRLGGQRTETVHETLDLNRFARRWVKALLPWRMPRATWWGG